MDYNKISAAIRLIISKKAKKLTEELEELAKWNYKDEDLYYKADWSDFIYPYSPSNDGVFKTLDDAVLWLSKQEHPMGFSGCQMCIGLYIDIFDKPAFIEGYDAEKLARAKRAELKK
jgi:hypothetical protein